MLALLSPPAIATDTTTRSTDGPKRAFFAREQSSRDVRRVADWVTGSNDNRGMPFVIVDKINAKVFVFDAVGRIQGAAPALLGLARGDDSVPGIGDRELSEVRPEERITPAGRFVAELGENFNGNDVVWVDYNTALSLHRVITTNPAERRLERLASPTSADNRISYGCINVPARFFDHVVSPAFTGTKGIVYVLPESRPVQDVFSTYGVGRKNATAGPVSPAVNRNHVGGRGMVAEEGRLTKLRHHDD